MTQPPHPLFDAAINKEYMPSQTIPNASEIAANWPRRSAELRAKYPPQTIPFGPGEREQLDVFIPLGPVKATILFIHGGYWRTFSKSDFSYMAEPLLEADYRVVLSDYDLIPHFPLRQLVEQTRQAVTLIARTFAEPLIISGHSAGGHLAAMMHATDWAALGQDIQIAGGIGISGLYDLAPLKHTELQPLLDLTDSQERALSPIHLKPQNQSPFIAAVGELETQSFHQQAQALASAWGDLVHYVNLPGCHHFSAPEQLLSLAEALTRRPLDP